MAINFPNSPSDGTTHTDAGTTWVFSSANNSWTVTSFTAPGISNGTNYENSLVVLDNVGGSPTKNLPIAAQGLEFNPTDKRLTIKTLVSQSAKPFAILDSGGAELNAFNVRGILDKAGRIYYSSTQPTVNAADTGQLWYDTATNTLKVSTASAGFDNAFNTSSLVTLSANQTITGPKTFSGGITASAITFQSNATIAFTGSNTLTNAGSVNISGTFTGNPTLSGNPTFSGNPIFSGSPTFTGATSARLTQNCEDLLIDPTIGNTSRIICSTSTDALFNSNDLQLSPNKSVAGRKIVLYNNSSSDPAGILIKPTNGNSYGRLQIEGATTVNGNFNVTGGTVTLPNTSYIPGLSTIGSFRNTTTDTTYNPTTLPTPVGPLTFAGGVYSSTSGHSVSLDITNTSTSPVSFYFRREINSPTTKFILQKVTMAASTTWNIANIFVVGGTTPATGVTVAYMGSDDALPAANTNLSAASTRTALILTITLI